MSIPKQNSSPYQSPSNPVELGLDGVIQIRCHKRISCFNVCCRNINLPLTPYDTLRLKRRLGWESSEFAGRYATPYPMDCHDLPDLKMNVISGAAECEFLVEEGCAVYEDRSAVCRYCAFGSMGVRKTMIRKWKTSISSSKKFTAEVTKSLIV